MNLTYIQQLKTQFDNVVVVTQDELIQLMDVDPHFEVEFEQFCLESVEVQNNPQLLDELQEEFAEHYFDVVVATESDISTIKRFAGDIDAGCAINYLYGIGVDVWELLKKEYRKNEHNN